ncbi:MAG TPA: hypothetical protein VFS10_00400 [Pyrinomonadaceae bacterium]|nr:hypothetical protein [Pyrinomonadaceae bacterium]
MSEPSNAGNKKDVPEQIDIDAVELKTIEVRLNGVKDATHRSRFIFIIMTIVTAAILITLWNSILSWDRGMAFEQRSDNPVIAENQKTVTSEWIKNLVISVGLLGIRVGTSDLAVLGSSSLIVIMVWFFFSQRRENRAIVGLLRYCRDGLDEEKLGKEVCSLVYEGIVQSIVFIDMGGGDRPIRGLISEETDAQPNLFIRAILKGLVFLPPFAILMIVISDISSLLLPSYLRDSKEELWRTLFNGKHNIEVAKIFIFDVFGLIACIYTWFLCRKCREFSEATSETIKEFKVSVLS